MLRALDSTWISSGEYVDRFEREFAEWFRIRHALSTANGTASLQMAYDALDIRPGDEVIVPGFGFLAAANVALLMGARPLFAEVDPETWCVTADAIERCLSARTKAIVAIHTYGSVCDMDAITQLADAHRIPIIEDAAEALGSRYKERPAGAMSTIGCFSFQATKTITSGEGGMVVTNDVALLERMTLDRNHGMLRQRHYWHEVPGHNFRLTNLQAALGCAQLESLPAIFRERRRVSARYRRLLGRMDGVALQRFSSDVDPIVWAVAVRLEPHAFPQGRDAVMSGMRESGVETRPRFYTPSQMPFYGCGPLPVCERLAQWIISVPSYPTLTDEQIEWVCGCLANLRR